jgi:membrane associated rhomboid family serine protease
MLIVINLVFTFAVGGISVGGHIGGLVGGVALMWLMLERPRSAEFSVAATVGVIAVSIAIAYWRSHGYS